MNSIKPSTEELQRLHDQYLNDPVRLQLLNQKAEILQKSIPKIVLNTSTREHEYIYDEQTKLLFSKIDELLDTYVKSTYKILFENSKSE